jgi:hypothetical protein
MIFQIVDVPSAIDEIVSCGTSNKKIECSPKRLACPENIDRDKASYVIRPYYHKT